jgi:hypothetical protein
MDILVRRAPADRRGVDIVDPLLSDLGAALARGRNEIDAASQSENVDIGMVPLPSAFVGALVEVHDALYGESWRGKVSGITHRAGVGEMPSTTLRIVRPT